MQLPNTRAYIFDAGWPFRRQTSPRDALLLLAGHGGDGVKRSAIILPVSYFDSQERPNGGYSYSSTLYTIYYALRSTYYTFLTVVAVEKWGQTLLLLISQLSCPVVVPLCVLTIILITVLVWICPRHRMPRRPLSSSSTWRRTMTISWQNPPSRGSRRSFGSSSSSTYHSSRSQPPDS